MTSLVELSRIRVWASLNSSPGNDKNFDDTGKYFSEALILASVNPQCDKGLFIEFPKKYKFTTYCVQKLIFCFFFDSQNNICTQHVVNLYFSGNSMSYSGLTDLRMRASEKDLPVSSNQKKSRIY